MDNLSPTAHSNWFKVSDRDSDVGSAVRWLPRARGCRSTVDECGLDPCACVPRTLAWFETCSSSRYMNSFDTRIRFTQTNVSLYSIVSYDILGTATTPVPACPQPMRGCMYGLRIAVSYVMRIECLHGHNQRVAWPPALAGGRSAREASTQARRDATSTQRGTK